MNGHDRQWELTAHFRGPWWRTSAGTNAITPGVLESVYHPRAVIEATCYSISFPTDNGSVGRLAAACVRFRYGRRRLLSAAPATTVGPLWQIGGRGGQFQSLDWFGRKGSPDSALNWICLRAPVDAGAALRAAGTSPRLVVLGRLQETWGCSVAAPLASRPGNLHGLAAATGGPDGAGLEGLAGELERWEPRHWLNDPSRSPAHPFAAVTVQ